LTSDVQRLRDRRQVHGALVISEWIGQFSGAIIISMNSSVAAFLQRTGGSMLARTGNHEEEWNAEYQR